MENLKNKIKNTLKEFDSVKDTKNTEDKLKDTIDAVKRTLNVDDKEAKHVVQGMYSGEAHKDMNEVDDDLGKNKSSKPNPWAICTASVGRDDKEKYEACVVKIKKQYNINEDSDGSNNYMFWQNLKTMKHSIDELLTMNQVEVDKMLANGHAWAVDHIATSSDDIEEVYHFIEANCTGCVGKVKKVGEDSIVENVKPKMTKGDLEKLIQNKK